MDLLQIGVDSSFIITGETDLIPEIFFICVFCNKAMALSEVSQGHPAEQQLFQEHIQLY